MDYTFNITTYVVPAHYIWRNIFMTLGTKHYAKIYHDYLDFPFYPSDDLQQIAHDYAFTYESITGFFERAKHRERLQQHGETASIDLLQGTSSDDSFSERQRALFANTFVHLERLGYAQAIYRWSIHTKDCCRAAYVSALNDFCQLLTRWAVLELSKNHIPPEFSPYSIELQNLVAGNPQINLVPLPISETATKTLQSTILRQKIRKIHLESELEQIKTLPKSVWEDFAFRAGTGSWIHGEGNFRINIQTWQMINNTLSADELLTVEKWVHEHHEGRSSREYWGYLSILPQQFKDFVAGKSDDA